MMEVRVNFDDLFLVLTKAGFNISIQAEVAKNGIGSISMHFADTGHEEAEAECNECNGCACEVEPELPNTFIVQHEQERTNMARLGLSDFPYHEQHKIIREAERYIKEHGIDEEDHKVIVHHKMRDCYLAYKEHVKSEK